MTVAGATTEFPTGRPDVELRLPADGAYVSVLRTTAAGLAARLDFTIEDIEDLRIAVGEATALVLPEADPESDLQCGFHLGERSLTVEVRVQTSSPAVPDYESFAWQVLTTLAASAEEIATADSFSVRLTLVSGVDL
ncbi:anti-sigma factor [Nocardioides zeae]|uniref:Anti-sigma factor n=1 Tax=Nocardioides imazamoxiresistens TaxID=3231893 RepID=A0ABU3PWT5_9ACTN|nr:anti-sigma factor [Nocardioides zeae]MDT9593702.1 anti-sigma factor [Nocardioides zeae]